MKQFNRKCKVDIYSNDVLFLHEGEGHVSIENLRIVFDVEKTLRPYNKARVEIYNLAPSTREWIKGLDKDKAQLVVSVKYADDADWTQLFKSDLSLSRDCFELPEIVTKFDCDDGRHLLEQNVTLGSPKDAKLFDLIEEVKKQVGAAFEHPVDTLSGLMNPSCKTGYSFSGKAKEALENLSDAAEGEYNVIDDKLVVIPIDGHDGKEAQVLSEETGLIGVPEFVDDAMTPSGRKKKKDAGEPSQRPGYDINALLSPKLVPGNQIHLITKRLKIDAFFNVQQVHHTGDTHGDDWTTKIRVLSQK